MKRFLTLGGSLLILVVLLSSCITFEESVYATGSPTGAYLTEGTEEFNRFTSKLLGTWKVERLYQFGEEEIGGTYKDGTVEIGLDPFLFTIELVASDEVVKARAKDWLEQDPAMRVEKYSQKTTWGAWDCEEKGINYDLDYIDFIGRESNREILIEGEGANLEGFQGMETMFSPVVGIEYIPSRYMVEMIDDNTIRLYSYEKKGIVHWNRDVINTDMTLTRLQ